MIITRRNITKISSVFVILVAGLTSAGWLFNITALYSTVPGLASMKFVTAICIILSGLALYASDRPVISGFTRSFIIVCSLLILFIALLTLAEYIAGRDLIISSFLRKEGHPINDPYVSPRMSIATTVIFILLSFVFLLLRKKKFHFTAQVILIIVLLIAGFTILGNIIGKDYLQGGISSYYRMAFNAGLVFTVLCLGIYYSYPLRYLKFSFQKKITGYLSLFLFILILIFFVFRSNNSRFTDTSRLLDHTNTVLMQSQQLLSEAQDIETGRRGFIITGKEEFLEPYTRAIPLIRSSISELKALTKDNPSQELRLDTLAKLVTAKIDLDGRMINLRKGSDDLAGYVTDEVKGKRMMDSIRVLVASIQQEATILLQKKRVENETNIGTSSRFTVLLEVIMLVMLIAVFLIIYNNTRRRNKAETDLQESHKNLLNEIIEREKLQKQLKLFNEELEKQVNIKTAELAKTMEQVKESEEKYRTIFYKGPLPKWIYDCETLRFLEVNDAAIRHYGYSREEFLKMTIKEIRPKEEVPLLLNDLTKIQSGGDSRQGNWHHLKKNGEVITVETTAHSIEYNNRRARLVVSNDITESKKAEEQLAAERTLLRQLIDNLPVYIYLKDRNSRYIICNRALVELAGAGSEKETIGKRVQDFFGPEIGPVNFEEDQRVFEIGEAAMNREESIITPAGERRWLLTSKVPLKNEKNNTQALIGISLDITEQKHSELLMEQLNDRLKKRAAELLSSNTELERFAYVASHDLQEPLRMVSSFLQLLEKKLQGQLDETGKQYIHFAVDGAERMKKLIQDLLQYSRVGTTTETNIEVNCNEVLDLVCKVFDLSIRETQAVLTIKPLPVIRGIKSQIQQLFQNLVGNALKYSGNKTPHIEVGCTEKDNNWQFYVKDNGIGIEPRFYDKIFIIFQRLHNKNEYSGTGIGLAICKKIVERHNGKIWVESEPGKGSTFYITLPK